jgi:hypothetical protein
MSQNYRGVIVKESLSDPNILEQFQIVSHKLVGLENVETSWDIITVETKSEQVSAIKELASALKEGTWYAHFWNEDELVVVFKDKIIDNREEAVTYARALGIPEEQLDFPTA